MRVLRRVPGSSVRLSRNRQQTYDICAMMSRNLTRTANQKGSTMHRNLTKILAVALLALLASVGLASPANAHHPTVTGTAVCNEQTGKFDVTWSIANSEADKVMTYTSRLGGGTVAGGGAPATKTETVDAGTHTLKVDASWPNRVTASATGTVVASGDCEIPPPPTCETAPSPELCEQPPAETRVDRTEGTPDCEHGTVTVTTTRYSTSYVWDDESLSWVPDEEVVTDTSTATREATLEECPPPPPTCETDPSLCPPPVDVCPNLPDNQTEVPPGYVIQDGECVLIPEPPTCENTPDLCEPPVEPPVTPEPPAEPPVSNPPPAEPPVIVNSGSPPVEKQVLPNTGGPDGWVILTAIVLLGMGGVAYLYDSRRHRG